MRSRTKAKRKPRLQNVRTLYHALAYQFDQFVKRIDAQPIFSRAMYTNHDDRIRTLEERVRNLTDYINRNRV